MVTAVILLNVERDRINAVAQQLAELAGISEVYSVTGRFDLVAIVRTKTTEAVADLVTGSMLQLEGITGSETLIAFRTYAPRDVEAGFSLGDQPSQR